MSEVNHQTLESVKHQLGNGNIANASQQFAKIANNGSAEWYALAGRLASAHGNLDHAARLFLRAHLKAPSNPLYLSDLSFCEEMRGHFEAALECVIAERQQVGSSWQSELRMAELLSRLGCIAQSHSHLDAARMEAPLARLSKSKRRVKISENWWNAHSGLCNPIQQVYDGIFVVRELFCSEELTSVRKFMEGTQFSRGTVISQKAQAGHVQVSVRKAQVADLDPHGYDSFYIKYNGAVKAVAQLVCCDLSGPNGAIQLTMYDGAEQGFYSWHADTGPGRFRLRAISCTVLLCNASEFDGGKVEFEIGGQALEVLMNGGDALIFRSSMRHRVNMVYSGRRLSAVSWFNAKPT